MNKDDQILLKHNGNVMQSSVGKSKQNRKSETKNGNQSNQIPNRMYIDPIQQHPENVDMNIDPSSGLSSSWPTS